MTDQLSLEGFKQLLDRHGGNLAAWPADQRTPAENLLEDSLPARQCLAETQALEAALAQSPRAPADLVKRIIAKAGLKPTPE